jgi:hypothetical protein
LEIRRQEFAVEKPKGTALTSPVSQEKKMCGLTEYAVLAADALAETRRASERAYAR